MGINEYFDAGGEYIPNPNYKKGNGQPKYILSAETPATSIGSTILGAGSAFPTVFNPDKESDRLAKGMLDYNLALRREDYLNSQFNNILSEEQSALSKFGNSIAQAAISEVGLGTLKGVSDLIDFFSGAVFRGDNDYSNPVSQYLGELQEQFKNNVAPIYVDPEKNISNGGLIDAGWWASNLPSVMSSLTLLIPSTGITKGLSWAGKALNTASKGKIGAFGRNAYKVMTGAGKAKTVEDAKKLNAFSRWLNDTNTMAAGQRMLETGVNAALMRTMENYQEAHQVHDDMKVKALDKFNNMSDGEYAQFINSQADKLGGVDVNDKEAVANKLAKDAADRTFIIDYANTVFDVIQLNSLRNPIKLLKNMRATRAVNEAQRVSKTAIGKAAAANAEAAVESGIGATAKKLGRGVGQFLKDSKHVIGAEFTEGIEEAVNYIAQEEGMHYGNVALGEDINNGFTSRLASYLRSPELYDAAFWGVLGGVVFQGLGSAFNRISVAAERYNQQKKKKGDGTTKEGLNYDTFQELFETSENKRRIADINKRTEDFNTLVERLAQIDPESGGTGSDPFNRDESGNPLTLETEIEKTIARERAISEYITGMTFRAMDNGNFDMLKEYLKDDNVRQALEEVTGHEGDGGAFIDSAIKRMDDIAEKYNQNLIALSNIARNVNITSESAIPIEYLQIIARDNTAAQIKLEDINSRIATYEPSAANKKAVYGDKLDQSIDYKGAVELVVLTQQLAQLKAKKAEIENNKDKQGIGRRIELDRINKNIEIVEDMITGQGTLSNSDALTKLIYAITKADRLNEDTAADAENITNRVLGNVKGIIGERNAQKFKITDAEILKILGEDRYSGALNVLENDIDLAFEGAYGINKIDSRLGDDYITLAGLNIEKAVLNESIVMNESNLNKRVNELHNEMLDARKQAIDKSLKTLLDLAKKYGREEVSTNLETGQEIAWENDFDKKRYDDALEVLNLTSANNQQLYDDIQYAIMMDEIIEASQNAANPSSSTSGESSSTSQNQNGTTQQQQTNNQSTTNGQTTTGQGNTLNQQQIDLEEEAKAVAMSMERINVANATIEALRDLDNRAMRVISNTSISRELRNKVAEERKRIITELNKRNRNSSRTTTASNKVRLTLPSVSGLEQIVDAEPINFNDIKKGDEIAYSGPESDNIIDYGTVTVVSGTDIVIKSFDGVDTLVPDSRKYYRIILPTTNSSTGGQESNSSTRSIDEDGNPIPDAQKEQVKKEIGQTIMNAVKTAKQNGTDATKEINKATTELNAKYGNDEDYKREINRIASSWNTRAKKQGLARDVVDLVVYASSVTEEGGKYIFTEEFINAAKKFADDFLKAINAKEFNGKTVVSFESMLRFANEQMEDPTTAQYIYQSLKAWFETNSKDYIVLDNMNSTSILQRASMTNRQLANSRLGGTNVFRVQIDQFLQRVASKAAIDKIQAGDTLNAKIENGDIILMVGDVEVGRLPKPEIDSATGGFKKTNNGWITDVTLTNGNVVSKLRQIWEDILLNKSDINNKINTYIYQIIAARKINADTKSITDAIEKDTDLKAYFDTLKQQGIIDKNANNVELIDGLVGIWNYIDLTNPDAAERAADINYSLDLWFDKLYDSYSTINNSITVGVNNLIFKVAKITDGDVIQVAANDNEGYEKCTLGTENEAFANVDTTQIGVIKPGSVGVIQTTDNQAVSQPNGSTGSMWAVLPNRSGVPGIVRGHALKFMDTDSKVNNTPAGRIRQAISKEFERRIREFVNDEIDSDAKFNKLVQFIDLVLGNNTSTPLLAPVKGGKFNVKKYDNERIVIGWQNNDNSYTNFTINLINRQYNVEGLGYKEIENIDSFINDFKHTVLANSMFNVDFRFLDSDSGSTTINGLATRDKDGNFVITIPNGTNTPLIEIFQSFKHFLMQGGAARWNTKNNNGTNWQPRSNNQLRNQVLNVSIEFDSSRPVEENVDTSITPETINNGQVIDTLLEKVFGANAPQIKRLQQAGLIPTEITYTSTIDTKGGNAVIAEYSISKKKIYVNDRWIEVAQNNPERALRVLIHENLHKKLHSKGNQRKETLKRIQDIVNDFKTALDNDTDANPHLKEYLFENIENNEERLEEFLVESLTNRELASYLNSVQVEIPGVKTKKSLLNKILDLLAEIFDWGVTKGSLYEKELRILQGYTSETQSGDNSITTETTVENVEEEENSNDEFDEEDYDGMASSVEESTTPTLNQFIETLPLEERIEFNNLLLDGTVSIKCS